MDKTTYTRIESEATSLQIRWALQVLGKKFEFDLRRVLSFANIDSDLLKATIANAEDQDVPTTDRLRLRASRIPTPVIAGARISRLGERNDLASIQVHQVPDATPPDRPCGFIISAPQENASRNPFGIRVVVTPEGNACEGGVAAIVDLKDLRPVTTEVTLGPGTTGLLTATLVPLGK